MANFLTGLYRTTRSTEIVTPRLPLLNEMTNFTHQYLYSDGQIARKKALMKLCKQCPELNAFLNKIVTDMSTRFHFEPVDPNKSNRNKILASNRFAQEVVLRKLMQSQVYDMLSTGEAYGWLGNISKSDVTNAIKKVMANHPDIEYKEVMPELKFFDGFSDTSNIDEDILKPRKYRYLPSTTVEITYDKVDITGYNHIVGTNKPIPFTPEEVIHYTLMDRDGKVNGFTSVESVIIQIELVKLMWRNQLSVHRNGGGADKIYILENTKVNTPEYKRMEQQLERNKIVENKHGDLLFTGSVKVEDIQHLDQMQFKDSGLYITGLFAMQWGITKDSIPYIIGGTNTKADTGGGSERGYWEVIRNFQNIFADTMNTQLWIPYFGTRIVFDNSFIHHDVQKETAWQLKLNNIKMMDELLIPAQKQLSDEQRLRMLGLTEMDIIDKKQDPMMQQMGNTLDKQLSKSQVNNSDDKANVAKKKQEEQANVISRQGMKPTGVGKESTKCSPHMQILDFNNDAEIEYKELVGNDNQLVSLDTFTKIYNEDKAYQSGKPPRLFMTQNTDFVSFKFKSSDFVYKVVVPIEEYESSKVKLMNLGTQIYRL